MLINDLAKEKNKTKHLYQGQSAQSVLRSHLAAARAQKTTLH